MILALDLSTKATGAAFGEPTDRAPRSLLWRFFGASDGYLDRTLSAAIDSVTGICNLIKPERVVIEAPLVVFDRSAHTMAALMQLTGAVRGAAYRSGCGVRTVSSQTVRKLFLGNGRPEFPKQAVLAKCELLGWHTESDDVADAKATWAWGMNDRYPGWWQARDTPLFSKGQAA